MKPEDRFGSEWLRIVICLSIWDACKSFHDDMRRRRKQPPNEVTDIKVDRVHIELAWSMQSKEDVERMLEMKSESAARVKPNLTQKDIDYVRFIHHLETRLGPI